MIAAATGGEKGACPWNRAALLALVSGGVAAAAFGPRPLCLLAWVAFVPFLRALPGTSGLQAWVCGTLLALVYYRIGLNWLIGIAGPIGGVAIVAYAAWMGLAFWLARLLVRRFGLAALLWAWPIAFVGQEVVRSEGPARLRFAYQAFGYSQPADTAIAHVATIGGIYAVSLLLIALNGAIAFALLRRTARSWLALLAVAAAASALTLVGAVTRPEAGRPVSVAAVQAEDLGYPQMVSLVERAADDAARPKLIVLPEHTIFDLASERHPLIRSLAAIARQRAVHICVGAHLPAAPASPCDYDNVGLLIGPDGRIVFSQAKAVPLPFFKDGNPARSLHTFDTPAGRLGIQVCYDADFTDIPRRYVDLGAEIMLVPVMNPIRWPARQRNQQAAMARFRAIETARPAVHTASSGTSMIVDFDGRIVRQREQQEGPGYICGPIHPSSSRTWFVRGGYLVPRAIGWIFLAAIAVVPAIDRMRIRSRTR